MRGRGRQSSTPAKKSRDESEETCSRRSRTPFKEAGHIGGRSLHSGEEEEPEEPEEDGFFEEGTTSRGGKSRSTLMRRRRMEKTANAVKRGGFAHAGKTCFCDVCGDSSQDPGPTSPQQNQHY
jgi:hypothetical protein